MNDTDKIGSQGETQVEDVASPEVADNEYDKLVREKRKPGVVDEGTYGRVGGDIDEDEVNDDRTDDDEDDD